MRDRIWQKIGVPVTVGIARTRTLAKFISDAAKPFGGAVVMYRYLYGLAIDELLARISAGDSTLRAVSLARTKTR
jgi:nucleotidyltransferase/DNA polymerase involved in DNA repair